MARILDAFETFFRNEVLSKHNNPDFFQRWLDNLRNLETQLLVSPEGGYPVEGKRNVWTDGTEEWHNIRFPKNAMNEPYWRDRELTFLLEKHWLGVGTTWWSWTNRESVAVGFDFDEITSHAPGTGVNDEQLEEIRERACQLDYVEVLRSTGGKGLHIYIWFDPESRPKTQNHTEHAAIARAMLGKLSTDAAFDFGSHLDVCGGNMWVAHKKMFGTVGLECVKKATLPLSQHDIPPNWKDHLDVIGGRSTKIRVVGVTDTGDEVDEQDPLTELTMSHPKVPLDEVHKRIISDLEMTGVTCVWVPDHNLVQTHTKGLKQVYDQWQEMGHPMRGFFDTLSPGSDIGKPNCLAGDTMVITRNGVKPIRDLAGKTATIITKRGALVEAPFKSYGEQDVFDITLKQRDQIKVIRATRDHRWFVYRYSGKYAKSKVNFGDKIEVHTKDLTPRQILIQTKPRVDIQPGIIGIQHGLVWGDGTTGGGRSTSELPLFGEKDAELLKFFVGHPRRPIKVSTGGTLITQLPYHFKSLVSLHYDKTYLYGWLAGYFAADGHVAKTGSCIIRSTDRESIEHVRQVCHVLGIETSQVTEAIKKNCYKPGTIVYTTCLKAADLTEEFFLLSEHRSRFNAASKNNNYYWRVVKVEPAGREEVFCCTVPETGCFCLEDFILTGNCFMIPKKEGSWIVFRFGKGTVEHGLWNQDRQGWTWCNFNRQPDLSEASIALGGAELESNKGFRFDSIESAKSVVQALGSKLILPTGNNYSERNAVLRRNKDGRLVVEIDRRDSDTGFDGWDGAKRNKWVKVFNIMVDNQGEADDYTRFDTVVRSCRTPSNADAGWRIRVKGGEWIKHPRENVASVLSLVSPPGIPLPNIMGSAILNQWILVCKPFHEEYPSGRQWNLGAPQLIYKPTLLDEEEQPYHPHWDRVMGHCGEDLDGVVRDTVWCRNWGIFSGKDYLTAWLSCLIREPFEPLPYLFMYGPQNSGKSIFHEAASLLVTGGVVKADRALTNSNDFNGELANAVLGVIDEVNISHAGPGVYNKIKEWTTSQHISIHSKYQQVYQQRNCLHFVQTANYRDSCPIFPGDTRITAMYVGPLIEEIPKPILIRALVEEAPHFMATLMGLSLPTSDTRLRLPILDTAGKEQAAESNRNPLEEFIVESCHEISGEKMLFKDFYARFVESLSAFEQASWNKRKVRQSIPDCFPVGLSTGGQLYIGNISFTTKDVPSDTPRYISKGRTISLEN